MNTCTFPYQSVILKRLNKFIFFTSLCILFIKNSKIVIFVYAIDSKPSFEAYANNPDPTVGGTPIIGTEPDGDLAFGFYPDSTIHLIGVAVVSRSCTHGILEHSPDIFWFDTGNCDSIMVRLYIPQGEYMTLTDIATLNKQEMLEFRRLYDYAQGWTYYDSIWWMEQANMVNRQIFIIRELYFDNEIDVSDSFYISTRLIFEEGIMSSQHWERCWFERHSPIYGTDIRIFPAQSYRVKHCEDCP